MNVISTLAIVSTLAATACADDTEPTPPDANPSIEAQNMDLLHRYHVDVWENHRLDHAGNYLAPTFVSHAQPFSMPTAEPPDQNFFPKFFAAFPDLSSHEDALLANGDRVSIQWTITATQTADFFGLPPTGKQIVVSGMDVLRVEDGLFVEQWGGFADQMDEIIAQLKN